MRASCLWLMACFVAQCLALRVCLGILSILSLSKITWNAMRSCLSLFASRKYVGMLALCYKLSVNILMGNLASVCIQGPYPAVKDTNIHFSAKFHLTPSTPLDPQQMNGPRLTTIAGIQTQRCPQKMQHLWRIKSCRLAMDGLNLVIPFSGLLTLCLPAHACLLRVHDDNTALYQEC